MSCLVWAQKYLDHSECMCASVLQIEAPAALFRLSAEKITAFGHMPPPPPPPPLALPPAPPPPPPSIVTWLQRSARALTWPPVVLPFPSPSLSPSLTSHLFLPGRGGHGGTTGREEEGGGEEEEGRRK